MIRSRRHALIALFLVLLGSVFTLNAQEAETRFQAEFDDAVEALRTTIKLHPYKNRPVGASIKTAEQITGWWYVGMDYDRPFGLDPFRPAALTLSKAHGSAAIPELVRRLDMADGHARALALITLAALADHPAAAEALKQSPIKAEHVDPCAMSAVTYAPERAARAIGLEGFRSTRTQYARERSYLALLRIFGDEASAQEIEKRIADVAPKDPREADVYLRNRLSFLRSNLAVLREKLKLPIEQRSEWASQDAALVQALSTSANTLSWASGVEAQAARLAKAKKYTAPYLAGRLMAMAQLDELSAFTLREEHLAIFTIIGEQRPPALIPLLEQLASGLSRDWQQAGYALSRFGTRDALCRIERMIKPPDPTAFDPTEVYRSNRPRGRVNARCARWLSEKGDGESLKCLDSLANDPAYPADERQQFANARDTLRMGPPRRMGEKR